MYFSCLFFKFSSWKQRVPIPENQLALCRPPIRALTYKLKITDLYELSLMMSVPKQTSVHITKNTFLRMPKDGMNLKAELHALSLTPMVCLHTNIIKTQLCCFSVTPFVISVQVCLWTLLLSIKPVLF